MEMETKLSEESEEDEEYDEEEEDYEEEEEYDEEEVFITPQSSIVSMYSSRTEKDLREICSEILKLKYAIVSQLDNTRSCYQAFKRFSQEAKVVNEVVVELKSNYSAHKSIVQDLSSAVTGELDAWERLSGNEIADLQNSELEHLLNLDNDSSQVVFLQNLDMLLAERKIEEALSMLLDSVEIIESNSLEISKRKDMLVDQLVATSNQPCIKYSDLKKALEGLIKLGREALAQELFLKVFASRLQRKVDSFLPSCMILPNTYTATFSKLYFSTIMEAANEFNLLFGEIEPHASLLVEWAESEMEQFAHLVRENAPSLETTSALCSACICIQASLNYCIMLEGNGLKLSDLVLFLLSQHVEEVIDKNFRRARKMVLDLSSQYETLDQSWLVGLHFSADALTNISLRNNVKKFMSLIKDILDQLTPMVVLHFRPIIMRKTHQLFDKYVEIMAKAIPTFCEDGTFIYPKEQTYFKTETEIQQLALLNSISAITDEFLPVAISKILQSQGELKEPDKGLENLASISREYKNWRRRIQHSSDKIIEHFCWQYVIRLVYTRKGKARLDAHAYLELEGDDLIGDLEPLPSLPFQALFARMQKLESIVNEELFGKEKVQKAVLSGIIEAMLTWLSNDQEFWRMMEDKSRQFDELGLQQFVLDLHFIIEIAISGGYSSRKIHQLVSATITRAIGAFAARGADVQSALNEDEWFSHVAKAAIRRLMLVVPLSRDSLQSDDNNIFLHDKVLESGNVSSSWSDFESNSIDSFASLNKAGVETPGYFSSYE
ncbi:hypothetical protein LUZ63_000853 [Rhynchospora breviuscula]|uniref:Exocyst component Exo84 C-terminal domain-containing protein n=1 Tax=Rhynchospora breviuscula TaxID=2022672 RepID=A0A9Q0CX44_9POAL|nr:hypothetical protein LUZ63_000853 [Rhynchospora breviuscula]